jgi:hypothetical protein
LNERILKEYGKKEKKVNGIGMIGRSLRDIMETMKTNIYSKSQQNYVIKKTIEDN